MENPVNIYHKESKFVFTACFIFVFLFFTSPLVFPQGENSFFANSDFYTRFQNLSIRDGLSNNSVLGMVQDYSGLATFNPDSLSKKLEASPTLLYDFFVNDSLRFLTINDGQKITLKYSENSFTVKFTSLDFTYAKTLKYRYCLKGFDSDWHYVNAETRMAKYTNLHWGEYTFLAEVSNPSGEFRDKPTKILIFIQKPWFVSCWFILLCVGVFILPVFCTSGFT